MSTGYLQECSAPIRTRSRAALSQARHRGRLGPKDAVGTVAGCGQVLSVRRPSPEVANHLAVPFYFGGWSASLSGLVVQCHLVHRNPPVQALDEVSDQSHGRSGLILHQHHSGMRREQRTAIRPCRPAFGVIGTTRANETRFLQPRSFCKLIALRTSEWHVTLRRHVVLSRTRARQAHR